MSDEIAEAVKLAKLMIDRGDDPPLYGPNTITLARAVLALSERCEGMAKVVDAACGLLDRAEKCHDRSYMGCAMDHGTIETWLYDEVTAYRAITSTRTAKDGE